MRRSLAAALGFVLGAAAVAPALADPINSRAPGGSQWYDGDGQGTADNPFVQRVITAAPTVVGDTAIDTGGTAKALFSGNTPPHGYKIGNPNLRDDLWCSDTTTTPTANGAHSYRVFANGGLFVSEPGEKPAGPVYCWGPNSGDLINAKSF